MEINTKDKIIEMLKILLESYNAGISDDVFGNCTVVHVKPDTFDFVMRKTIDFIEKE